MTFTHARCGGVLAPIEKPDWWPTSYQAAVGHAYRIAVIVRCRKCRLEGEAVKVKEKHPRLVSNTSGGT